jgi:uncharacterized protein
VIDNVLLSGVVGSTAYGLAGPDSDVDRLGVFAHPTVEFHRLEPAEETIATSKPDVTFHEARKFAKLALAGNPTVAELLWLEGYETTTALGIALIGIRRAFLSAKRCRDAYFGYAVQQLRRLEARGDGTFSSETRKRTAKHARHLYRLCHQGFELWSTGEVQIRLTEPQRFLDFGVRVAGGDVDHARQMLARFEAKFDATPTVLPEEPQRAVVENWLLQVRAAYL